MIPQILFEDEDILVLNKPAGVTVNRSDTTKEEETLQDWVEEYLKVDKVERVEEEITTTSSTSSTFSTFMSRAGIVHRLDKETSGIIVIAKNPTSFENLQAQFKNRIVKKTYLALVHGKVEPEEGEINVPVGRLPWNRKRFGVLAGGRDALTKYKAIKFYSCHPEFISGSTRSDDREMLKRVQHDNELTLLELYPETGRTHQIRVHLQHIHHPIFADFLYGGRKTARNDRKVLNRVFLHASKISFEHPSSKEDFSFEAPLPEELENFLKNLSSN